MIRSRRWLATLQLNQKTGLTYVAGFATGYPGNYSRFILEQGDHQNSPGHGLHFTSRILFT